MAKNERQKSSKLAALGRLERRRGKNYDKYLNTLAHRREIEDKERRDEERNRARQKGTIKSEGPRGKFMEYIEDPNLTVDEAMDKFVEEQTAFLRKMLEGWLSEDLKLGRVPNDCLEKVKAYVLFKYISEPDLSMQEVIDKFMEKQPNTSKKEVVRLLVEYLNTDCIPNELRPKVKEYLSPKIEERIDDEGR